MNELTKNELQCIPSEAEKEVFVIKDLSGLNWAFKKMRALKLKVNEINEVANNDIDIINDWREKELEKYESDLSYFEYKISEYHENELLKDPKRKSISTPYGKVTSRRTSEQPEKTDSEAIKRYLLENEPNLIKTVIKEEIMWSELKSTLSIVEINGEKKIIDSNGIEVPGIVVKEENVKIKVEVNE